MASGSNGSSDPLAISSEELRVLLENEIDHHDWLNSLAHILGEDHRTIYKKLYTQKFITFNVVDAWLSKLGIYWLDDGTLTAVPNPRWTKEKWLAYMESRGCA